MYHRDNPSVVDLRDFDTEYVEDMPEAASTECPDCKRMVCPDSMKDGLCVACGHSPDPFKSQAQARFMFSQHPEMAKEWASKTPSIKKLPEKVK